VPNAPDGPEPVTLRLARYLGFVAIAETSLAQHDRAALEASRLVDQLRTELGRDAVVIFRGQALVPYSENRRMGYDRYPVVILDDHATKPTIRLAEADVAGNGQVDATAEFNPGILDPRD
jgi:hypothetical protein